MILQRGGSSYRVSYRPPRLNNIHRDQRQTASAFAQLLKILWGHFEQQLGARSHSARHDERNVHCVLRRHGYDECLASHHAQGQRDRILDVPATFRDRGGS